MNFKIHLLIVASLIAAVLVTWNVMLAEKRNAVEPAKAESPYKIIMAHASWGANCRVQPKQLAKTPESISPNESNAFLTGNDDKQSYQDNVLQKVAALCDNKITCDIPINTDALGDDPFPACFGKTFSVEYRCFSFDRPWLASSTSTNLVIDCSKRNAAN